MSEDKKLKVCNDEFLEKESISRLLPNDIKREITSEINEKMLKSQRILLSKMLSIETIREDVLRIISPDAVYIARIPKKLKEGLKNGSLTFMHEKKSGESIGTIVDAKKKNDIQGLVRIEESQVAELTNTNLSLNVATLAMQQQLAEMTEVLDDIRSRVIALQEGHDNDLFGTIIGMRDQIVQMRGVQNLDRRERMATDTINTLNIVRGKIQTTIISELENMKDVPDSDIKVIGKILGNKSYLTEVCQSYDRIEELFSYYIVSSQLLGYIYSFFDEPQAYVDVFMPPKELLENANILKLKHSELLYVESVGETWYKNPAEYLLKVKSKTLQLFEAETEFVEIEITGDELLEMIEND